MYNKFFGFKDKPFKLAPNPDYLFLSKSHEKTLTHLLFATSRGKQFVGITGEAGTGKTILCKAFLGNLDESIKAAYIFNQKLDEVQLLKAINDAFGIDSKPDNTKDLTDILNGFLIKKEAAGQKVLLLIDEAQNLSPEFLEQHLLFANPETTDEKLLQIILVGQPELRDMLSSSQLKELGRSITISCQLEPLTFLETIDYIRHRLSHASFRAGPPIFDKASCRVIYDYSKGIPQLINIGCEMALQKAFNRNSFKITGPITREAIKELTQKKSYKKLNKTPGLAILSAVLVALIIVFLYFTKVQPPETAVIDETVNSKKVAASSEPGVSAVDKLKVAETSPAVNQSEPGENISAPMVGHSVHVGTFVTASQANWRLKTLKSLGFPSFTYTRKNNNGTLVYVVVAGKYSSYELAEEVSRSLSEKGHYNYVVRAKGSPNEGM